jgi:hypothetical protein
MATQTVFPTTSGAVTAKNETFIRRVMIADAIFETICAGISLVAAGALATWTGWSPTLFTIVGIGIGIAAVTLYGIAFAPTLYRPLIRAVMVVNLACAVGAVALLLGGWGGLTEGARILLSVLSIDFALLGVLQIVGLRKAA